MKAALGTLGGGLVVILGIMIVPSCMDSMIGEPMKIIKTEVTEDMEANEENYTFKEDIQLIEGFDLTVEEGIVFDSQYETIHTDKQSLTRSLGELKYSTTDEDHSYILQLERVENGIVGLPIKYSVLMFTPEDLKAYSEQYSKHFLKSLPLLNLTYEEIIDNIVGRGAIVETNKESALDGD